MKVVGVLRLRYQQQSRQIIKYDGVIPSSRSSNQRNVNWVPCDIN